MDEMRDRYRVPQQNSSPANIPEALRHAYQPPPARAPEPRPLPQTPPPPRPVREADSQPSSKRRPGRKILAAAVLLILITGGGVLAYPRFVSANPFPADIQTSAGYHLLYPSKLPAGYTIDKTNISYTNGVVIYAANNGDKRIVFTLQKLPAAFDFDGFYKQQLTDSQRYATPFGPATIGKNSNRYLGSLTTGGTWLLVSDNSSQVSIDDIALAMTHLKQY